MGAIIGGVNNYSLTIYFQLIILMVTIVRCSFGSFALFQ